MKKTASHNGAPDRFLSGKVAVVTGGTSIVGYAIARSLAEAGADIALGSMLREDLPGEPPAELGRLPMLEDLEKAAKSLEGHGVRTLAMKADVTSLESVLDFFAATQRKFDRVDILVNAATAAAEQTVCGHSDEVWERLMEVNVTGPYRLIKACLPGMMQRRWGRILNVAPAAVSYESAKLAAVAASRAALVALTRHVGLEGAANGVSCNTLSQRWVEKASMPLPPEEIGDLAVYLCRDESVGLTMQEFYISVGMTEATAHSY